MNTFKLKTTKSRQESAILTLDKMHRDMVDGFRKQKEKLPRKRQELELLKELLETLESKPGEEFTHNDIHQRANLKTKIEELSQNINDIENDIPELEYYSKTDDLIMNYYDILDDGDRELYEECPELANEKTEKEDTSMTRLDKLNAKKRNQKKAKKSTRRRKRRGNNSKSKNIMEFFGTEASEEEDDAPKRADLLIEYRSIIDADFNPNEHKEYSAIIQCSECEVDMQIDRTQGMCVCPECFEVEMIITECERPNYRDPIQEKPGYPYKRINHFNEWLSQFQAKESTEIPKDVYKKIKKELEKNRIYDYTKLTLPGVKKILKKLGLTTYYERVSQIISKLSGLPPPTISRETEDILRRKFREIQMPFERHCPRDRINFLSYSYVLHKFCQLMELDEFLKYFPLLKSREKLRQQDKIWRKICDDLLWEFIQSI